jgi:hypothetical protein
MLLPDKERHTEREREREREKERERERAVRPRQEKAGDEGTAREKRVTLR